VENEIEGNRVRIEATQNQNSKMKNKEKEETPSKGGPEKGVHFISLSVPKRSYKKVGET